MDIKTSQRERQKRHRKTEKYKATQRRYRQSEKGKTTQKRYEQTEKFKAYRKRYKQTEQGKISRHKADFRYYTLYPERKEARNFVNNAVKVDKLPRPDTLQCHYCPTQAEQYHHWHGYAPEHYLDVIPVCRNCHRKIHKGE